MLNITNKTTGSNGIVAVEGRLDTTTAPLLEEQLKGLFDSIETLVLDFGELEYISSAGLRVLLSSQKIMQKKGGMTVKNSSSGIKEIFETTGFTDILTIE
ncbi:MAG: STAS domain-containing protein [Treponema sp.]|nr:STAS domain-containing protein [Treponema sp.]